MKVITTSSFYIVNKGVFNVGQVVEFDDELAKKLIKQGVVKYIEEQEKEEEKTSTDIDYNKLKVAELKRLLQEKGIEIPKGAKKADLINLLND